jgi:hypothetical protein
MKRELALSFRRLRRDESGAVIVLVAIMIAALIGLAALAVDVGNLAYTQRRLQATADMAALAGAAEIACSSCASGTENTIASLYSGTAGSKNAQRDLAITMVSGYPKGRCLTGFGTDSSVFYNANTGACTGLDGYNAMEVQEQATVPFTLGQILGFGPVTLTATSLAGAGGGLPALNIMIVLDTTASMNDSDPNGSISTCGVNNPTRIQCALFGVRTLLAELWPTRDQVGLMVFPQVSTTTTPTGPQDDYSCSSSAIPTVEPYTATTGATYQIISSSDDYRTSNSSSTLSGGSQLANASGYSGTGSCAGLKSKGGEGTYYAGVITAAQNALVATDNTGVCGTTQTCQNVIVFLSDGGAGNAGNLWSSTTNQATLAGGSTLTMAATVPADVIPGSSVADNTTSSAIPSGTQVLSTSGKTVTLSATVTAAATATTNAATAPNSTTLHFASVPSAVATGMAVNDSTNSSAIASCTTVVSKTSTTVILSNAVVGTSVASALTSAPTLAPNTTLTLASLPTNITTGMGVTDTTNSSAIPSGTTIVSISGNTVTISNSIGHSVTGTTNGATNKSTKLTFNSLTGTPTTGMTVTGSGVAANTTVTSVSGTTVTISQQASVASGTTITFSSNNVATGDTIVFSKDVASGDTISFGGVGCGDTISFGSNDQCHEAITAAQDAANAGTWVYSIAYGSSTANSPNSNSCSDAEYPAISSCYTMGGGETLDPPIQGIASDPSKFYSDTSGGSGSCTSSNLASDLGTIFQNIGNSLTYTALLPNSTN